MYTLTTSVYNYTVYLYSVPTYPVPLPSILLHGYVCRIYGNTMEVEQLCKISGANGTNAMGNISLVVMADIAANGGHWRHR